MAELIIQSGKHQGRRLRLADAAVVIGRDDDCQIRLTSSDVSKHHCCLRVTGEGLLVEDLGSSNGTFVNDSRIESATRLMPGDRLRVGPMVFEVPGGKKKPGEASGAGGAGGKKSKPLSEDDIASWLSDDTDHGEMSAADTTVIPTTAPPPIAAPAAARSDAAAAAVAESPGPREERRRFRTVADEAADIIRRWWEVQKEESS